MDKLWRWVAVVVSISMLVASLTLAAQLVRADAPVIKPIGHYGGAVNAIAVQERYAYIGRGPKLEVVDIANPADPTIVGQAPMLDYPIRSVAVAGLRAYVAAESAGVWIADVSDPAAPRWLGHWGEGYAGDLAVKGSHVFVACGGDSEGLYVLDAADPAAPQEIAYVAHEWDVGELDMEVAGDYLHTVSGALNIWDISDPSAPIRIGYQPSLDSGAVGVGVYGNYVYVAYEEGIQIVDVSDPFSPYTAGSRSVGHAYDVAIEQVGFNTYAYVACFYELVVVDVTVPAAPDGVETHIEGILTRAVATANGGPSNYLYVACQAGGLRVIDIAEPLRAHEVGQCGFWGWPNDVAPTVDGNLACVRTWEKGISILDVSDPRAPQEVGAYETSSLIWDMLLVGDYLYFAQDGQGVRILDLTDPAAPHEIGAYTPPLSSLYIDVEGQYLYSARGLEGLRIADISDPTAPQEMGFFPLNEYFDDLVVAGDYAYLMGQSMVHIIDVSDPATPHEVGSCGGIWDAALTVAGDYVYIATYEWGLKIMDVSDPTSPHIIGSCETPGFYDNIAVAGDYAFIGTTRDNVRVFDVSDRTAPVEIGIWGAPDGDCWLDLDNGLLYAADGDGGGLWIVQYKSFPYHLPLVWR